MKKKLRLALICVLSLFALSNLSAQTTLAKGDIAIVSMSTGGEDFAFVTFVDLDAGTVIYFTDEEADGDLTMATGEGTVQYTAPAGGITAGTVVTGNSAGSAMDFSSTSDGSMALGNSGDGIIAYQGTSVGNVTTFLHAVGEDAGDLGTFPGGTLSASDYILMGNDDGNYTGTTTGTASALLALINDNANWTVSGSASINPPASFSVTVSSSPTVSFDSGSSSETETDATFGTSIPVTLTNYDADVTISITVNGASTAEGGDYTLNTTSLVFDANETLNISLDINDDADSDNETVILDISVSSGTADLGTSQHTVTITDDDLPQLIISEIMYNTPSTDDEWIEIYNGNGASVDVSNWTIEYNSSTVFTFPSSTSIADGDYITIAIGSNGDGTFNNENTFTPDYSSVADPVADTNDNNNLGNTSGTITLKNDGGSTIDEVAYDDGDASSTDGGGPSYEIMNLTLTNSATSSNWQASVISGGSPGEPSSITWTGATSNDWTVDSNWGSGNAPISTSDVLIPSSLTTYPTASGAVTVNSATINSGATLIAQSTFAGTVTYNRFLSTTNWYLVAAPVDGQTIVDFYNNESPAMGSGTGNAQNVAIAPYDNSQADANNRWAYYTEGQVDGEDGDDTTDTFTSATGYSVKMQAIGDIAFTGTLNVSDFTSLSLTDNSGASGTAFNLMGNPYTSYVAADNTANATNNILSVNTSLLTEETIWIWDQSANAGAGGYTQYNNTSGFHIAPGQGFFVSANGNSSTFSITEAMQSHQSSDTFQRTNNNRPEINLVMTDGTNVKDVDIFYIDGMTTGFDNGYDSSIFGGLNTSFAIYTQAVANGEGRNLGIQSLPNDGDFENMVIPVGMKASSGDEITISATSLNLPDGINVYLEDKNDNSFTLLDASSNFVTTLTEDADGIGRFYLHTRNQPLSTDDFNLDNISIYKSDENNLRIVGIQNGTAQVRLYNILGKQVVNTMFEGNGVNDVTLPSLRTGVYIIQLETETGKLNKKVIIE